MEDWKKRLGELSFTKGYYFKLADNGLVEKKDDQLIFNREVLESFIEQELDRAREEVLLELLEKKTNYKIEEVGHGYKVTQEYVLVSDIEKELSKLKSKQEWKRR